MVDKKLHPNRREKEEKDLDFKSIAHEQGYLNKPCLQRLGYTNDLDEIKHGAPKREFFGWDVFNDDAVYNAYKKRCTTLQKDGGLYNKQMEKKAVGVDVDHDANPEALERLSQDINR
jgi:calcium/calmodulin-dependent protein kinase (CaM kinase) II/peptidyl-prolyl isomerase G (cyclophilin G)